MTLLNKELQFLEGLEEFFRGNSRITSDCRVCSMLQRLSVTNALQRFFPISKTTFWWTSIKCIHDNNGGSQSIRVALSSLLDSSINRNWEVRLTKSFEVPFRSSRSRAMFWSCKFTNRVQRLIQSLDYLSVASPESGLFSDWSRNKRYLDWTKPKLVSCAAVWLPIEEILRADEFHHDIWWGERRERVFVSFKCFSCQFCSQISQRWTNRMHS